MASCFLDCQPLQLNRCGALLCRGDYEIGQQQLPVSHVCRLWCNHGINFTKPWKRKHRSHAHFSIRVKSVFYYKVFRAGTPFLKSDSDQYQGMQFFAAFRRVPGSMLVMIRRDRRWLVGVCAFHFLPTVGLPVGHTQNCAQLHTIVSPHARQDVLAGTITEQCLDQPIIPYGVPSVMMLVKTNSQPRRWHQKSGLTGCLRIISSVSFYWPKSNQEVAVCLKRSNNDIILC